MKSKECLKRIDERNYLTEREHKEFLSVVEKDLDRLEELRDSYEIATSKLKMAIEIILKYKINPSTFIFTRKIYKESCGKDLTFEKAYSLLEFDGTQEEYELLKEVLENDK